MRPKLGKPALHDALSRGGVELNTVPCGPASPPHGCPGPTRHPLMSSASTPPRAPAGCAWKRLQLAQTARRRRHLSRGVWLANSTRWARPCSLTWMAAPARPTARRAARPRVTRRWVPAHRSARSTSLRPRPQLSARMASSLGIPCLHRHIRWHTPPIIRRAVEAANFCTLVPPFPPTRYTGFQLPASLLWDLCPCRRRARRARCASCPQAWHR